MQCDGGSREAGGDGGEHKTGDTEYEIDCPWPTLGEGKRFWLEDRIRFAVAKCRAIRLGLQVLWQIAREIVARAGDCDGVFDATADWSSW